MSQAFRMLGLDPGGSTGYAWTEQPRVSVEQSGIWELGKIKDPGRRFDFFWGQLELFDPTHVVYERPEGLRAKAAQTWHYGYLAIVQLWSEQRGARLRTVQPSKLKLFATGRGGAKKQSMANAACEAFNSRLPATFEHDQVDALWVLAWGLEAFELVPKFGTMELAGVERAS